MVDMFSDLQRQGFMRGAAKRAAKEQRDAARNSVSDAQFRANIAKACRIRQQKRWDAIAAGVDPDTVA